MRYPATITMEGKATVAVFHFADGTECSTFAEAGESIEAQASDALRGRLASYQERGEDPPRPGAVPAGDVLWVDVPDAP